MLRRSIGLSISTLVVAVALGFPAAPKAAGSGKQLSFVVSGVTALVDENGKWTAALPLWPTAKKGRLGYEIPGHVPYLLVPVDDCTIGGSRVPDDYITPGKGALAGKKCARFRLDHEWLRLNGASVIQPTDKRDPEVVSLDSVCSYVVNDNLWRFDKDPKRVASRVEIGASSLRKGVLTPGNWGFHPIREEGSPFTKKQLAQEVILDFQIGDSISLAPVNHDKWTAKPAIVVEGIKRDLTVVLANTPVKGLTTQGHLHENIDPHFELLFNLMEHSRIPHFAELEVVVKNPEGSNCPPGTRP